tara:strand:+ start:1097 stop:1294 length:198 start_codon:yes stop_codon:yes gene_type:complete
LEKVKVEVVAAEVASRFRTTVVPVGAAAIIESCGIYRPVTAKLVVKLTIELILVSDVESAVVSPV